MNSGRNNRLNDNRSVEVVDIEVPPNPNRNNNRGERLDTSSSIEGQGHSYSMFRRLRRSLFIRVLNEILMDIFWVIFWLIIKIDVAQTELQTDYSKREQEWLARIFTLFCLQQAGICLHRALLIGEPRDSNRYKFI